MQRRDLLRGGSIAIALTVAGCTSSDTEDVEDSTGNGNGNGNGESNDGNGGNGNGNSDSEGETDDSGAEDENNTDSEDASGGEGNGDAENESDGSEEGGDGGEGSDDGGDEEAQGEASLEIVSEELSVEEGEFATDAWVEFAVENTGDGPSGEIVITSEWYDEAGDFLGDMDERLVGLGAGETWVGRVYALTEAENVDDFELSGEFGTEAPAPAPDGLEFLEGDLQTSEDEATFNGRVENATGEEVGYVQATVKFYDADGNVMGSEWTNETDLPADTTWSFDLTWLDRRRASQVDDFEVFLADSPW